MLTQIKSWMPTRLLLRLRRWKAAIRTRNDVSRSTQEVFTEIYAKNVWGGEPGSFYSGGGSDYSALVDPYVDAIEKSLEKNGLKGKRFLDLGCGDFAVGRRIAPFASSYLGADIVEPLIRHHQETFATPAINFVHLNLVTDPLPDADVCFIRQVLQHLSNDQIAAILKKLSKYRAVYITEHYPDEKEFLGYNFDKVQGAATRGDFGSGVYLDQPPFSIPRSQLTQVLAVPHGVSKNPGVLRSFLYQPA